MPWSLGTIANIPIDKYRDYLIDANKNMIPELNHDEVETYIRKSGGKIIARKGATFYAVAVSVCHIVKCIFSGADTSMTVSTMHHGEYGWRTSACPPSRLSAPTASAASWSAPSPTTRWSCSTRAPTACAPS